MNTQARNIWEQEDWPRFHWQIETVQPKLEAIRCLQGQLHEKLDRLPIHSAQQVQVDVAVENIVRNHNKQQAQFNLDSFISSAANLIKHDNFSTLDNRKDALLDLWCGNKHNLQEALTKEHLCRWHKAIYLNDNEATTDATNDYGKIRHTDKKKYLTSAEQRESHFEPPPDFTLPLELTGFLYWFNHKSKKMDGLTRAAVAHLWIMVLQPFKHGNETIAKLVTDFALAQTEPQTTRYYSLSAAIEKNRYEYDRCLNIVLAGTITITDWLNHFFQILEDAHEMGVSKVNTLLEETRGKLSFILPALKSVFKSIRHFVKPLTDQLSFFYGRGSP